MSYSDENSDELRFGDILLGFPLSASHVSHPIQKLQDHYKILTNTPRYSVVIDPSCSIGDRKISLSPLKKIPVRFFHHPRLKDNLLILNKS